MDEFETIVKRYEYENDAKVFSKVLRTAEILLAEDLAPFETGIVSNYVCVSKVTDEKYLNCFSPK